VAFKALFLAHAPDADVAEISKAVGEDLGVFVARGDGPSNRISMQVMKSEGWFSE